MISSVKQTPKQRPTNLSTLIEKRSSKSKPSFPIRQSSSKNNLVYHFPTETSTIFDCSKFVDNPAKQEIDEKYIRMKQKIKEKIKRIISSKKLQSQTIGIEHTKACSHSDLALHLLKTTYIDYISKQLRPSKEKKMSIVLENTPHQRPLILPKSYNYQRTSERYTNEPNATPRDLIRIRKKAQKLRRSQTMHTSLITGGNFSIQKKVISSTKLVNTPKLLPKPFVRTARVSKTDQPPFLKSLEPWTNNDNNDN